MNRRRLIAVLIPVGILGMAGWLERGPQPRVIGREVPAPGGFAATEMVRFRDHRGFRLFDGGFRIDAETTYPVLPSVHPVWQTANRDLQGRVRESVEAFLADFNWRDWWYALRTRAASYAWTRHCTWTVDWASPRLVSLRSNCREYTGGAHGNTHFEALNLRADGEGCREVALADFFLPDSGWSNRVAARVTEEINRIKRANRGGTLDDREAITVPAGQLDEGVFTISPEGFRFWFAPYEMGSYAEGSFEVLVPFERVLDLLDRDGPARWLPCFPSPP